MRAYTGADKTVYAQWEQDGFVIRFDTGTNQSDEVQAYDPPLSVTYTTDSTGITLPGQAPERPGYTFKGWSYTYNGNTTIYGKGQKFILPAAVLASFNTAGGNIVRLTAVWERYPEEQLIAFVDIPEYGGKTNTVYLRNTTRGMTYGEVYEPDDTTKTAAFPTPESRNGYYFDGWADANGNVITAQTPVGKEGFHLVYARWIPAASYSDVSENSPYYPYISKCKAYGYMEGTDTDQFSPDKAVTRGIAAVVMHRLEGSPIYGNNLFYDVDTNTSSGASNKMSEAITWLSENNIASGMQDYYFGQNEQITREQLMVMLYKYVKYRDGYQSGDIDEDCLNVYSDKTDINSWALEAMKWAVSQGIILGVSETELSPGGSVTRGQLAAFIIRTRKLLVERCKITEIKTDGTAVNEAADQVGILYKTLADNTWETISAASRAGVADIIWNVGDEISMTLSTGEVIDLQIYGFNHDKVNENTYAGITFGMKSVMKAPRFMHDFDTNRCSYQTTQLGIWLYYTLSTQLPGEVSSVLQPVNKECIEIDDDGNPFMTEVTLPIFLFSEEECFGRTHHSFGGEGTQYEIFKNDPDKRVKVREPQHILEWWLRSPCRTNEKSFCIVHSTGQAGYVPTSRDYIGVSFGFCV